MKTRHNELYENDTTPSREVARLYRETIHDDDQDASLALVDYRGGEEEFLLGKEYSLSDDAGDRATGADILAQLGWADQTFLDESVAILTGLLDDPDLSVIHNAAVGLGHRPAESAIPRLLELALHPDSRVRYGIVFGLTGYEDDRAIAGMIRLAADEDPDVRNWAVFGLGSQIDTDTLEIREALRRSLSDPDPEIRGEGLVGLAKRGDPAIVARLFNEWQADEVSLLSIEAAEESGDPRLYPHLKDISEALELADNSYFAGRLAKAMEACKPTGDDSPDA